ncbi:phosphatase PAP2 family protein [Tomitella gaofuii]|uniref:phosphatase PAP2 family protein n=1 Tax=Tomitella gaofuii TaxID=2760083 RepID=UPI0015FA3748|nr:phosphatase PAP2 family protein [Tomitella gaofuii]
MTAVLASLDGASIDGSLYLDVNDFARDTGWLHGFMTAFTDIGLGIFALLMVVAWWRARRRGPAAMAAALAVPVATVVAYIVSDLVKAVFDETRPCHVYPRALVLGGCDPVNDYAFPSNHSVIVAAAAVGLFLVEKRWGIVAAVVALVLGFSRVYVGAHYPHDVLAGLVGGTVVGLLVALVVARLLRPVVRGLTRTPLRPLVSAG